MATNVELKEALKDVWQTAQDADGSRGGMQEALDIIQDSCAEVLPELEEEDDSDGDGIPVDGQGD